MVAFEICTEVVVSVAVDEVVTVVLPLEVLVAVLLELDPKLIGSQPVKSAAADKKGRVVRKGQGKTLRKSRFCILILPSSPRWNPYLPFYQV